MTTLQIAKSRRNSVVTKLYTAEQLEAMPSHRRVELIRGELTPMPNNSSMHGVVTYDLAFEVGAFVRKHNLGRCFAAETRFILGRNPDTVLGPDFAFIAKDRIETIPATGYLEIAPDLIFETRSPSDRKSEYALKIAHWLSAGVKLVWAVDPKTKTVTVHRTGENPRNLITEDTLTGEDILPGFEFPLEKLFV